jgi:hypothetical protein
MSVIAIPAGLQVHTCSWGQRDFSLNFDGGDSGSQQARILAPPRWLLTMSANLSLGPAPAAAWRAMLLQLRGKINQLAAYDVKNPTPKGTITGAPTLTSAAAVGDTSIAITTTGTLTMSRGDKFQLGTGAARQLFEVMVDAAAVAGALVVTVEPPSRYVQSSASAVVISQPTCLMRRVDTSASWSANANAEGNFTLNLIESWET